MSVRQVFAYFCIVLCVVCTDIVHADVICDDPGDAEAISKTLLKVYKGTPDHFTSNDSYITDAEILESSISREKDTVLYIHGFLENTDVDNVKIIIKAYLERQDVNLILIDWGNIAINVDYIYASKQAPALGRKIAEAVNKLSNVINSTTFHVVGHSLGAQIGAHVARNLDTTLPRLTGLDSALPLFYPSKCHIKPTDADIVVSIHTDGGLFGTPFETAKIDFYANKGVRPQPGCILTPLYVNCSHQRSVKFYAESVRNPKAFPAHKCSATTEETDIGPVVYFGDNVPETASGRYCFSTNAAPPYSKNT